MEHFKTSFKNPYILPDEWFSHILQKPVYKIAGDSEFIEKLRTPDSQEHALMKQLQSEPCFMYVRLSTMVLTAVKTLMQWGFLLVDTRVVFEKPVEGSTSMQGYCDIKFADSEDEKQTVALGRMAFVCSRFHLDNNFSRDVANHIKAEWVQNYFLGKRGEYMVVAVLDGKVIGFLQLLQSGGLLTIDLIAVDNNYQKKGIARDMAIFAERQCKGCRLMQVVTQIANTPSIRFYEKLGFRLINSQYVFHFHKK